MKYKMGVLVCQGNIGHKIMRPKHQKRSALRLAGRIILGAKRRRIWDSDFRNIVHNLKVIYDWNLLVELSRRGRRISQISVVSHERSDEGCGCAVPAPMSLAGAHSRRNRFVCFFLTSLCCFSCFPNSYNPSIGNNKIMDEIKLAIWYFMRNRSLILYQLI